MPRLFTALEVPTAIAERLALLRGGLPDARWISPENYHLTLRFAGAIDGNAARTFAECLEGIREDPFTVQLTGLDAFGGRQPRAIFAKAALSDQLERLQAAHERAARAAGLPPEGRKFTPHVTLARLRGVNTTSVANYLATMGGFGSLTFTPERFVLYSARESIGGGPYVVEAAYPLTDHAFADAWTDEDEP